MNWTSPQRIFLGIALTTVLTQPLLAETLSVCIEGGCDFSAIQPAIDAAADGDVIEISAGTYLIDQTIDTNGKAVTIHGTVDPETGEPLTLLDGQGSHRVLQCLSGEGPDTVFEDLVIRGGNATGSFPDNSGGGMYNSNNSSPTLINCTFTNNSAEFGGGMYNNSSSPTLTDCTFMNNSADDSGGGMYNRGQSLPTLIETTVCENSPDQIAGSYTDNGGNCVGADCDQCDCPADLDGDGVVDASDLTQLLADWGCLGADCAGDVNNDGLVDGADLTVILSRWGACSD